MWFIYAILWFHADQKNDKIVASDLFNIRNNNGPIVDYCLTPGYAFSIKDVLR